MNGRVCAVLFTAQGVFGLPGVSTMRLYIRTLKVIGKENYTF